MMGSMFELYHKNCNYRSVFTQDPGRSTNWLRVNRHVVQARKENEGMDKRIREDEVQ